MTDMPLSGQSDKQEGMQTGHLVAFLTLRQARLQPGIYGGSGTCGGSA